jgi:PAS domain S-box-containing protein
LKWRQFTWAGGLNRGRAGINSLLKNVIRGCSASQQAVKDLTAAADMHMGYHPSGHFDLNIMDMTSEIPRDALEQNRAGTPASAGGWSVRRKIISGFAGLIALMALGMGFTLLKLAQVEQVADQVIERHQPAAQLFQHLAEELNLATTLLNGYLLTGHAEHKTEYAAVEQLIVEHLTEARSLTVTTQGEVSSKLLDDAEKLLVEFQDHAEKLFYLRDNNDANYPGMALAEASLLPPAIEFLGRVNLLIASDDLDINDPQDAFVLSRLHELRYSWVQMMSNLRLFLTTQGEVHVSNFENFSARVDELLDEFAHMDVDLGFGELEEMIEIRKTYLASVPPVIKIFRSDTWRADAYLMKTEVRPVVEELRGIFEKLADTQVEAARASGQSLTDALQFIRVSAIVVLVVALMLGTLVAIRISGDIIPPIQRLMQAAQHIAGGDLNAEVMVTSKDEIGQLGTSFNAMIDDLRRAALKEQKYLDELKELNQDLEDRVKQRTTELEGSEAKIRAILDNIGEGIVVIDDKGFIESINPAAEGIFLLDKDNAVGLNSILLLADEAVGNITALDTYKDETDGLFRAAADQQPTEHHGQRSDGSKFPMEFVVSRMALGDKNLRVCIIRDITARKEAEASLADAQHQLVDAAHKSGMADMATGVLHNIGNILNSVNLAGEEIARIAAGSKVGGLQKANEMLAQHRDDMARFLTQDDKGRKLPDYYLKIGPVLAEEIGSIAKEARALTEKTTMMKEVISTQQAYARAGFHTEDINVAALIEDALKIQDASLHKWGITLHKNFGDVPLCCGQKSKLLQVITNLLKNAKEAMGENDVHNKTKVLSIETGMLGGENIFIKIRDNGCGIDNKQLSKIFNHGFTTKHDGHGFGLHTSANAMTEMKGSLKVESDGPQQGACFTITLPISRNTKRTASQTRSAGAHRGVS